MNVETFLTREQALSDRLLEVIQKSTEAAPVVVLGSLMTLAARTCVALELTPSRSRPRLCPGPQGCPQQQA